MSDHKYVLKLSLEAYDDLVDIQNYTYQEYGENQWLKYGDDLEQGMNHILNHPFSGHTREDIPKDYLVWPVREHLLIYRIELEVVYLVRILHERMDFRFQF
jgi:toxin ParE1/3/4